MLRIALVSALLALTACSPASEPKKEEAGVDIPTPKNPFFGTWEMTNAKIAPWWDHKGEEPAANQVFTKFTFAADKSSGPAMLTCDKPRYTTNILPQRSLFEGNLPDPATDAPALGFTDPDVMVMSFDCISSQADIEADFPMVDDNTIMLGLDNVLYTFQRTGG